MTYEVDWWIFAIYKDAEVDLHQRIRLPFVPFNGLRVSFPDGCDSETTCEMAALSWHLEAGVFSATTFEDWGDNCPCTPSDQCCVWSDESKEWWGAQGFTVDSVRRGEDRLWLRKWSFETRTTESKGEA